MSASTSKSQRTRAIKVQLYCPEIQATVDDCIITPSMTTADILEHIIRMLPSEEEEVFICDINGELIYDKEEPSMFSIDNVVNGERLLIGTYDYHRIRPEPELKVELYLEADGLGGSLRVS